MTPEEKTAHQEKLRENLLMTLDMFETGLALMREKLHRENTDLSDEEVEERLTAWLRDRPPSEKLAQHQPPAPH